MNRKELQSIGQKLNINCGGEGGKPGPCKSLTKEQRIELDKQASKLARDIESHARTHKNDAGMWKSETAKKKSESMELRLQRMDAQLDD